MEPCEAPDVIRTGIVGSAATDGAGLPTFNPAEQGRDVDRVKLAGTVTMRALAGGDRLGLVDHNGSGEHGALALCAGQGLAVGEMVERVGHGPDCV